MKKIIMIFGTLLLIYSMPSWSKCSTLSSGVTINTSPLMVQRDVAVGTRLVATQIFTSSSVQLFSCPSTTSIQRLGIKAVTPFSGMTDGGGRIYTTNIPGLGVQLGGIATTGQNGGWVGAASTIDGNIDQGEIQSFLSSFTGTVTAGAAVTFYKIGNISPGTLSQTVGRMVMGDGSAGGWATEIPVNITGLNVTVLSCSLTTPTFAAPLGNIYATAFTGVGSTAGNNDFNLGLNCTAGTKVNVTMHGTQNTDTVNTSVLALTGAGGAGVAKGVGAQILYNNTPLNIGSTLLLKTSAGGIETFPFKARYYQTLSNISPGSANATATLNIAYQ